MAAVAVRGAVDTPRRLEKRRPKSPTISRSPSRERKYPTKSNEDESYFSRAASYTDLPRLAEPHDTTFKRTFSEDVLSITTELSKQPPPEEQASGKEILRRASTRRTNRSTKVNGPNFHLPRDENGTDHVLSPKVEIAVERVDTLTKHQKRGSVAVGLGAFSRRKSWFSSSPTRSPDLPPVDEKQTAAKLRNASPARSENKPQLQEPRALEDVPPPADQVSVISKKGAVLSKRRPLSALIPQKKSDSEVPTLKSPSVYSLRYSKSFEKLPSLSSKSKIPTEKVPPVPSTFSTERFQLFGNDSSKKKDELWGAFRTLEGSYSKFQSKPSALKADVVRSALIPFLNRNAVNQSYKCLRPEDLDRRISILNKWWTGLLEMLNGKANQGINGVDRHVFLEAVTGIMIRPEWRIPPFPAPPVTPTEKTEKEQKTSLKSGSTTSLESGGSDFLVESIYHNIRNLFVQNLLAQMAFVVERMSMKSAPASFVTFCGKAAAYAFFFCPGVADILIRLWDNSPGTIRAIIKLYVDNPFENLTSKSKELAPLFPPTLRALIFTSHASFARYLRTKAPQPLGAASIRWESPGWKRRWIGRDSDLFFVFAKQFHILMAELIPADLDTKARLCLPGLVPVHGQILTTIEDVLRKGGGQDKTTPSVTFDEVLDGEVDASAAALPMTSSRIRSMAESRPMILLRDFLAESVPEISLARQLFAESFAKILKAVARKTSQFNSFSCFAFCDFMEEVVRMMFQYRASVSRDMAILDLPFWMGVLRQMTSSNNTLTDVRVIAFVYSTWNTIVVDDNRKRELCLGWLLDDTFFRQEFNHWCPMVRGYFHRLLTWRLARLDDQPSELDIEILETLRTRLFTNLSHVKFLQRRARKTGDIPLSTAPCTPAPQRRLIIIREESQVPRSLLSSFDHAVPDSSSTQATAYKKDSLLQSLSQADVPDLGNQKNGNSNNKRWSILKFLPTGNSGGRPGEVTPPSSSSENASIKGAVPNAINAMNGSVSAPSGSGSPHQGPEVFPPYEAFSFRFNMELVSRPVFPGKNMELRTPKLPSAADRVFDRSGHVTPEIVPMEPTGISEVDLRYAGRALAEWARIVEECNSFFERRRDEGVPADKLVETPLLAADSFATPR